MESLRKQIEFDIPEIKKVNHEPVEKYSKKSKIKYDRYLGQFFTPKKLVDICISLIKNKNGRVLEPSCGDGAFEELMGDKSVFLEIDKNVIRNKNVLNMDFFDYSANEKFDTIIGNPPYVDNAYVNVNHKTGITVQANLYLYFIEKCFYHLENNGEIIFIVPREFIKTTSASYVNELLYKNGTFTHYFDFGDEKLFKEGCPNVCIFRYEKDNFSRKTKTNKGTFNLAINNGMISFSKSKDVQRLGDICDIKVGAVSGADKYFEDKNGEDFVFSKTCKEGILKKMIYDRYEKSLDKYKQILLKRGIKKFNEDNWFRWGRAVSFYEGKPRVYVNCKTRNKNPFFISECDRWDGSVLAIFPKKEVNLEKFVSKLNLQDWETLGFMTGGRYVFSQKSLQEATIDADIFG